MMTPWKRVRFCGCAVALAVSMRAVQDWTSDLDKAEREERRKTIQELWLSCHTAEEIGLKVGLNYLDVAKEIKALTEETAELPKSQKLTFSEEDFKPPLYNVWAWTKCSNEVEHFGNPTSTKTTTV